jgi:hypothetical protein
MKLLAILCHNTNGNVADLTGFRAVRNEHLLIDTKENHENAQEKFLRDLEI